MIRQIPIAIGIVLLLAASGSAQTVRYVDANADQTPHDGSDWGHAYLELYDALAVASSGDTIRVADGIYKPTAGTDRAATFQLIDGVTLEGGYAGCGAPDPDARDVALYETILSGDIGTPGANSDNCYHVVRGSDLGPTTVLDGFTVTAGNSNHPDFPDNCGGGMRTDNASLTVTNCTFTENASGRHGAGAILAGGSPTMTNCTFSSNTAVLHGGAMFVDSNDLVVANCTFHDNASWKGAGMHVSSSTPTVTNCTFTDNSAQFHGGGLYLEISSATVTNCILWGNTASDLPEIALWGACGITVSYSDIQGGWTGTGNIDDDPMLDVDGVHLLEGSPCINAGDPEGDYTDQADIDGEERVQQCRVEMGADETPFFVEDCNGNGLDDVECDLAEGTSLDCNSNVVPDECDIAAGTSLDCQPNDVPDECDLAGPTSDDVNGNGIPDECDLTEPLEPAYPDNRQRNRYIAFAVNKATMDGLDVAFKITLNSLVLGSCDSSGVPDVEGWACRVDADCRACSASENPCWSAGLHCGAGETCDPTGAVCLNDHTVDVDPVVGQHSVGRSWWVGPEHPTTGVHLMVTEAYRKVSADWANPVIVSDCELVPAAVYEARAVLAGSGPPEIESDPLDIKTAEKPDKFWADCVGSLGDYCAGNWRACTTSADCGVCYNWNAAPTGDPNNASSLTPCITDDDCPEPGEFCGTDCLAQWPPPDGFINFHDINAAVFTFSGLPSVTSTDLPNVDLHGDAAGDANVNPPNYIVNFNDIGLLVKAFEGWPYPYSDPGDCPDVGTWP